MPILPADPSLPAHPAQPLITDADGVLRFRPNAIVPFLRESGPCTLADLERQGFGADDEAHFAQRTGWSLSGFGDVPYISDRPTRARPTKAKRRATKHEQRKDHHHG